MPTFATPGPIAATVQVAGARVRVTASDRTDTVVLVEPIDEASRTDVKVADKTKVDFAGGRLSVKTTVSGDKNGSVAITIDLPAGSSLVAYLAHSGVHADGSFGECELHMASGRVQLDRIDALQANIAAGEVGRHIAAATSPERRVRTARSTASPRAAVRIGHASADLELSSASGGFDIDRADGSVTATTASGAIRIGRMTHGQAKLMNGSGNIEVGISEGTAASRRRQQRARVGAQLRLGAGQPGPSDDKVIGPRPHAARRHHHSTRSELSRDRSRGERDLDQLGPARLRTLLRHLGEPCFAEVTPRVPLDPGRIRVGAIRQSAYADAGREQPRRLLVLVEANRQVRDPDEHLGDHEWVRPPRTPPARQPRGGYGTRCRSSAR